MSKTSWYDLLGVQLVAHPRNVFSGHGYCTSAIRLIRLIQNIYKDEPHHKLAKEIEENTKHLYWQLVPFARFLLPKSLMSAVGPSLV